MQDLEFRHQCAVVDWWGWKCKSYALPEFALAAYPSGGLRHKSTAGKMKAMGTRRGIPDLSLPVARGDFYIGLAIEMKSANGRLTDAQKIVIPWLRSQGWRVEVCYNSGEAIKVIEDYLLGAPGRNAGRPSPPQ